MFYWLIKRVFLGPFLRFIYRPKAEGLENVPAKGPVILAANHLSVLDSLFLPLFLKRPVVFLGKADYFYNPATFWFVKALKVIPVRRDGGPASEAAIRAGTEVLREGGVLGIYPEGTRSPDARLYRGKTGVARLALEANCPVVPVVLFGTRDLQPPGRRMPRLSGRVRVVYGKPLRFDQYQGKSRDRYAVRAATDEIMYEIMMMSGQEYVDEYASRAKAGDALPPPGMPPARLPEEASEPNRRSK
ncbi:MAG: lysophospholipid acyltransferase family protein [Actinomycetota bacterium]